ncbi:MAG TPA: acyltransferase [Isosphaeraceae bacterium]|nr:acyltransferase [Isosphaeraceae bacterium]
MPVILSERERHRVESGTLRQDFMASATVGWLRTVVHAARPSARRLNRRCGRPGSFLCAGGVQVTLGRDARVEAPRLTCVIGARVLGGLVPRSATTVINVADGATLALDGVTIGRGSRIGVNAGARLEIGPSTALTDSCWVAASRSIVIGRDCAISWNVTIFDDDGHGAGPPPYSAPVVIGDRVWIGCNATILKGVTIGPGSIVAAGAVVTRSCPPRSMIAGIPARVIRHDVEWTDAHRIVRDSTL